MAAWHEVEKTESTVREFMEKNMYFHDFSTGRLIYSPEKCVLTLSLEYDDPEDAILLRFIGVHEWNAAENTEIWDSTLRLSEDGSFLWTAEPVYAGKCAVWVEAERIEWVKADECGKPEEKFCNITMTGRLSYIFLCIERYLITLYPERDWSAIARRMWQWTSRWWNEAWDIYAAAVPEFILEYPTFEETNEKAFEGKLDRADYDKITACFCGITDGNPEDEICRLLMIPADFGNACEGTGFAEAQSEVWKLIAEAESILEKHGIALPDMEKLEPFIFDRDDGESGWGGFENTESLSEILN